MPVRNLREHFAYELGIAYDAEQQFVRDLEEMAQNTSNARLRDMVMSHLGKTREQIRNLDQVYSLLGLQPTRQTCEFARGFTTDLRKGLGETTGVGHLADLVIAGAFTKVEHSEVAMYRALIVGARSMGQNEIVRLLETILRQEEHAAQRIEQARPELVQTAAGQEQRRAA